MLNPVPSSKNKRYLLRINPFYLYLDTCYTFNQNINNNTIWDIRKVVRGTKSHINRGVSKTKQKGNYGGFLGYLYTWSHPNGMGYILSFIEVEKLFVITHYHKEKTFVVHTKVEENKEGQV